MPDKDGRAFTSDPEGHYEMMLPCAPKDFGQFISGLLGKPQTIEREFYGAFEVSRKDIENTFFLVDQRINQQNAANLIQFTVRISYNDNSSVLLNSLEDFMHYTEIRPIISTGVHLSWTYLVKFQKKQVPEKQQIDLSFSTRFVNTNAEGDIYFSGRFKIYPGTVILLRISHTERTWGVDIESLLSGHVKTLIKKPKESERFIYKNSDKIGFTVGVLLFIGSLIGVFITTNGFVTSYLNKMAELNVLAGKNEILIKKIDFLTQVISSGVWPRFILSIILFIVVSLVISILLGMWVSTKAENEPHSFVLLSSEAEKNRELIRGKRQRDWYLFGLSIIISIITGVVSNVIFQKYFGKI